MIEILLPIKPISYNAYYRNSRTGKRIKTGKGHAFDEELDLLLRVYEDSLRKFRELLDPSKFIVKMTMQVGNPDYYLKDGSRLSMTGGDVDNYLKVTQDKIFKEIGFDDYICKHIEVIDYHSLEAQTKINLELRPHYNSPIL